MTFLEFADTCGVLTCALYGHLLARRSGFDLVGLFFVSFVAAYGGGTLRDLCLTNHRIETGRDLLWIATPNGPVMVFLLNIACACMPRLLDRMQHHLRWPDAVGLASFTMTGAGYGYAAGLSDFNVVLMGLFTGVFGGVISDIICNRAPNVFKPTQLYATCSFCGAWVYVLLRHHLDVPGMPALIAGFACVITLRVAAIVWNLHLPAINKSHGEPHA